MAIFGGTETNNRLKNQQATASVVGPPGQSAYALWLTQGNIGSCMDAPSFARIF